MSVQLLNLMSTLQSSQLLSEPYPFSELLLLFLIIPSQFLKMFPTALLPFSTLSLFRMTFVIVIVLIAVLFALIMIVIDIISLDIRYDGVDLDHEHVLLLADGVLLQHLLEHDPIPEFHPLREHPVLLPEVIAEVHIDAGGAGVLCLLPQGDPRGGHGGRVGVLDKVCHDPLPTPEKLLVIIRHDGASVQEAVSLEGVQHIISVSHTEISLDSILVSRTKENA